MLKLLQTRTVTYRDLCAKGLINDLKQAASCDVSRVCRLSCLNCPYLIENIDTIKIAIKGLREYTIELKKAEDEPLLMSISAPSIDDWLIRNNLHLKTVA